MIVEPAVAKVQQFIETHCIQSKSPWNGKPIKLMDWQLNDIIRPLYGTLTDPKDYLSRVVNKAMVFCPKKVGKSTLLSALSLYHCLESKGNECYIIAGGTKQAEIIFKEACAMVELNPALNKDGFLWTRRNIKMIECKKRQSFIQVLPLKPSIAQGWNASFICYDEFCSWQPASYAREIIDNLKNACMARKGGLQFFISHAYFDKTHIGHEIYQYGKKVKENPSIDPHFLPVIYEVPEDENWHDENVWWKYLPSSIGITAPKDHWRQEYKQLEHNPHGSTAFKTLLLNQWQDGGAMPFVPPHHWDKCKAKFSEEEFYGSSVVVGLDAARKFDIAAYVIIAERNGLLHLIPRIFIAEENAQEKEKTDNVPYLAWARDKRNCLYLTPGDEIDASYIRDKLIEDSKRFKFRSVGYDEKFLQETRQVCSNEYGLPMVNVPQNWAIMSPATALFERMALAGKLRHQGNPIMSWSLASCVTKEMQGQIMIEKKRCRNRVDVITAAIIAMQRWSDKSDLVRNPLIVLRV